MILIQRWIRYGQLRIRQRYRLCLRLLRSDAQTVQSTSLGVVAFELEGGGDVRQLECLLRIFE
jgi:hypothetical protein